MGVLAAVRGLVRSEEDLATLAMTHVLDSSDRARSALNSWLAVDGGVRWVAQHVIRGDDEGLPRPDIVGYTGQRQVACIEAKFDAGLTGDQPIEYLRRLPAGGLCVMLVPQRRLGYLTDEVLRRLDRAEFAHGPEQDGWDVVVGDGRRRLSFVTWDQLIRHLLDATQHPDARDAHDDLEQISDLVDQIQDQLYEPLSDEDLTDGSLPRTVLQLLGIFGDLVSVLEDRGLERYGRYNALVDGAQNFGVKSPGDELTWFAYFGFHPWQHLAPTPFWFGLHWEQREEYDHLLLPLLEGAPPRAYRMDPWNTPGTAIPFHVEADQDRAAVLTSLADQIEHWIAWGRDALAGEGRR